MATPGFSEKYTQYASLPNAGVAIFAGGYCTFFDFCVRFFRMGMSVRGMRERVECGCVYDASLSHALCSWL